MSADHIAECRRFVASIAAGQLDQLSTRERVMACEGIASLFPEDSQEAASASQHATALRAIEKQQLLLTELLRS